MKDQRYLEFQATLQQMASGLVSINGYDRLKFSIEDVADWDGFQAIKAQIDTTLWFKDKGILKEIEPRLPHRAGYADILLSFSKQDIYCEVNSLESLAKSLESKTQDEDNKIESRLQKLKKRQPWLTKQYIENKTDIQRITRHLLRKTDKQLPPNHPGILALETSKAVVFQHKIQDVASRLFQKRPHVMLIMIWRWAGGIQIGEPPFWFVNPNSPYQNIGRKLLEYLKLDNKVLG